MKRFVQTLVILAATAATAPGRVPILDGELQNNLDAKNNKVINLGTPLDPGDAAPKSYVDANIGGGGGGAGLTSISLALPAALFQSPVNFSIVGTDASGTAALIDAPALTLFGNNAGSTGPPAYLTVTQIKTMLAISNLDNTSDANKPISTATQTALNLKADASAVTTALALKYDTATATTALAGKEAVLPASPANGWVLTRDLDQSWHFVDPISLGGGGGGGGGTGTVTSVGVTNNESALFSIGITNATSSPVLTFNPATVGADTFYGNGTAFAGTPGFMSAGTARTAMGGTMAGQSLFTLANPTAVTFPRINADNSVTARTPAQVILDLPVANGSQSGVLASSDWSLFGGKENSLTFNPPLARTGNIITATTGTTAATLTAGNDTRLPAAVTGLRKGAGSGSADTAAAASGDYVQDTAQVGSNATNTWPTGVTNFIEGTALTANRTRTLPPTGAYAADGTTIKYTDSITTGGFGPLFVPAGSDTLKGSNASAWTAIGGYAPFTAGGYANQSKSITFQKRGADWRVYSQGGETLSAQAFQDPVDPNKMVTVSMTGQTPLAGYVFRPATAGDSVSVVPQTAPAAPHQWFDSLDAGGTLGSHAVTQSDVLPTETTVPGTADTTVLPNDGTISSIKLVTPLNGIHVYTLPDATNYSSGETIVFYDSTGNPNGQTARIAAGYNNTVNGANTFDINDGVGTYFRRAFSADPTAPGNWVVNTVAGISANGLSIAPFTTIPRSGNNAILTCNASGSYAHENNVLNLTTATTALGIINAVNGTNGTIRVRQDTTGGRALTLPTGSKTTPAGAGLIDLTGQAANQESQLEWNFDASSYNFTLVGSNYTASAASAFTTISDQGAGSTTTTNPQGDATSHRYLAGTFTACGTSTTCLGTGTTYIVGKADLQLLKVGNPTYNLMVAIYADNGSTPPADRPTTLVGTASANIAASTLSTSESTITFTNLNATLTAGTKYHPVLTSDQSARNVTDGNTNYRTVTNGTFNGTTTLTSATANFVSGDVGSVVTTTATGVTLPANTTISSVTNSTTVALSNTATGSGTGSTTIASKTVTSASAAFVAGDVGNTITGTGMPSGTTIASVTNGTTVVLSGPVNSSTTTGAWAIGAANANNYVKWASGALAGTTFVSKSDTGAWTVINSARQPRFTLYK